MINKDKDKEKGQGWKLENTYINLPNKFFSKMAASTVSNPEIIALNKPLAKELGLDSDILSNKEGIDILSGNNFPEGSIPIAQAYSGHQFGHFTSLGDGRAVLIGEQRTPNNSLLDIQLKGAGPTPYSRTGDGRATVGPMLREYIISEAMEALGIPTSRSLSVVSTKDKIYRKKPLNGAVLCRVAESHIRVGTFEYASKYGTVSDLRALADYSINRHYKDSINNENPYLGFLIQVINKQAVLMAKWMLVGFIHGVMNTDNMTIAGETIDYGPCAFMDTYNPKTVFSSIDKQGRYAYGNQPKVARWNLAIFAETLLPLLDKDKDKSIEKAKEALGEFDELYYKQWFSGIKRKLGLISEDPEDKLLIANLLELLELYSVDFNYFFTALTLDDLKGLDFFATKEYRDWQLKWKKRILQEEGGQELSKKVMEGSNPWIIPRNRDVEKVLKKAVENQDYLPLKELLGKLSVAFDYTMIDQEQLSPPEPSESQYKTYCGT